MRQLSAGELPVWIGRSRAAGGARPLLLDVREPWEFALAAIHVDGADTVNLPMNDVPSRLGELADDEEDDAAAAAAAASPSGSGAVPNAAPSAGAASAVASGRPAGSSRPIVCICHHGMRSAQVVAFLANAGFDSVYNLAGGIDAWSTQVDAAVPRY